MHLVTQDWWTAFGPELAEIKLADLVAKSVIGDVQESRGLRPVIPTTLQSLAHQILFQVFQGQAADG